MDEPKYNLGLMEERETIVNIPRLETNMEIYTCDETMITKLEKLVKTGGAQVKKVYYNSNLEITVKIYILPKKALTLRDTSKKKEISEEQKAAARERIKKMLEKRKSQNRF